jgi:hypothetical protein
MHLTSARWLNRHRRGCKKEYGFFKNVCKPHLVKTDNETFVGWWQVSRHGINRAKAGWNHRHRCLSFTNKNQCAATHTVGYRTPADLEAGWDGRLAIGKAIEGTQFRPETFARSGADVPDQFSSVGVSGGKWARLRFRVRFANHPPKGWSMKALCRWGYGRSYATHSLPSCVSGAKNWPAALFSAGR